MNRRCSYKHSHHLQQSTMFLPIMFCSRSSLKDVALSHSRRRSSDDPPSPKFRFSAQPGRNSKASGIKSNHAAPSRNINTDKFHKLGRLFSAKSLTEKSTAPTTDSSASARSEMLIRNCYLRNYTCGIRSKCVDGDRRKTGVNLVDWKPAKPINVAELDPPLPVVRRQLENGIGGEERESLWKRRSRGSALGSLQVHSVHGGATSLHTTPASKHRVI